MGIDESEKYWYNMTTGEVEYGRLSPAVDRVGPFETENDARHAMEHLRENSERWSAEEEAEGR